MELTILSAYVAETSKYLIILTLGLGAMGKTATFAQFCESLNQGFDVPHNWTGVITSLLIACEGLAALMLFQSNFLRDIGMVMATLMLAFFTLILAFVLIRGRLVRCNCFGSNNDFISLSDIVRNLLLLLACFAFLLLESKTQSFLTWYDHTMLGAMALMLFMIISNLKIFVLLSRDPKGAQNG